MNIALGDILIAPAWLAVNLFLAVSAWRLSRRLFPSDNFLEKLKLFSSPITHES